MTTASTMMAVFTTPLLTSILVSRTDMQYRGQLVHKRGGDEG